MCFNMLAGGAALTVEARGVLRRGVPAARRQNRRSAAATAAGQQKRLFCAHFAPAAALSRRSCCFRALLAAFRARAFHIFCARNAADAYLFCCSSSTSIARKPGVAGISARGRAYDAMDQA